MNKLPIAKTDNFVVQDLNDEVLIYDLASNKAFCLNQTSAIVYQACDGKTTFDELQKKSGFPQDLIHLTLAELEKQGFVELPSEYFSTLNGMSRREAVKKVGLATMIALPIITSVAAPSAATASSACIQGGKVCIRIDNSNSNCCDGFKCFLIPQSPTRCLECIQSGEAYTGSTISVVTLEFCQQSNLSVLCCNLSAGSVSLSADGMSCLCP